MFKNALFSKYLTVPKLLENTHTHTHTHVYVCTYKHIKKFTYTKLQNIPDIAITKLYTIPLTLLS